MKHLLSTSLLYLFTFLVWNEASAQYPQHSTYNDENGLPSNEVYSIVQDQRGFIWFGCDAGLFKFDGIKYSWFKAASQNSKSIANLRVAPSGRIYCGNFQDQLFCLENDSLHELKHTFERISNIEVDQNGLLYVCHNNGIGVYDEAKKTWRVYNDFPNKKNLYTRSVQINDQNEVYFIFNNGLGKIHRGKTSYYSIDGGAVNFASQFLLGNFKNELWFFSRLDNLHYTFKDGRFQKNKSQNLLQALENKKITNIISAKDDKLWICTYKGIICYDQSSDSVQVLYPNLAFSDMLIDREGNYWFTTLQTGIFRVPDLSYLIWDASNDKIRNDKLIHISSDGKLVYFSSVNGFICHLNTLNNELINYPFTKEADLESFDYDPIDSLLYFTTQNTVYSLKDKLIKEESFIQTAAKSILHYSSYYFVASSQGLYVNQQNEQVKIWESWCRQMAYDTLSHTLIVASDKGLLYFKQKKENQWQLIENILKNTQILSLSFDQKSQNLYYLSFDGFLYVNKELIAHIPESIQATKLRHYQEKIYIATNKGLWILDLKTRKFSTINRISGLASDNVQDLIILSDNLWLATGLGLQKIPLKPSRAIPLAKIYLPQTLSSEIYLNYKESLLLSPEASIYSSNGNFEYAYRIGAGNWTKLPSSIGQIEIQNLPIGKFLIELKSIDHLGRDSENSLFIKGYVHPPFWLTWRFIGLIILSFIALLYFSIRKVVSDIRKREKEKNELLNSQLKAIRAQMNPHFMYNTLNSIQDLILQQDIKNTNYYLSRFSQLMRQILSFSEEEKVLISEEIEMLQSYLELEKLRFGKDFTFVITIDDALDIERNYLPSMILQPIVENAIKHGLLHKKGSKTLKLEFNKTEEHLIILIEDNGIGRKRSAEIKNRATLSHKSFASNAVQKRVDLLNKSGNHRIIIETEDINSHDENTGTRIKISVNLKELNKF